jgi:hypothetical protein
MASIRSNKGPEAEERKLLAAGKAAKNADSIKRALAGAETVPAVLDSSGNAIADASPLSIEEREDGKKAVQ